MFPKYSVFKLTPASPLPSFLGNINWKCYLFRSIELIFQFSFWKKRSCKDQIYLLIYLFICLFIYLFIYSFIYLLCIYKRWKWSVKNIGLNIVQLLYIVMPTRICTCQLKSTYTVKWNKITFPSKLKSVCA